MTETPSYYKHPSGLQPYQIAMHLTNPLGDCFIYVARAGKKEGVPAASDVRKALDQFKFERERREEGVYERMHWGVRGIIDDRMLSWVSESDSVDILRNVALSKIVNAAMRSDLAGLQEAEDAVREFGRSLGVDV